MRLLPLIFSLVCSFNTKLQSLDHEHLQVPMDEVIDSLQTEAEKYDDHEHEGVSTKNHFLV